MLTFARLGASIAISSAITLPMGQAFAGQSTGTVTALYAHVGDLAIVAAGPHGSKPACSTVGEEWAFSVADATGKAMLAILLTAQAQGKSVVIVGSNTCTLQREIPLYIQLLT